MARSPKLNWTKSLNQYTTTIAGKFYRLGPDKEEAVKKYQWCLNKNHLSEPINLHPSLAEIADLWLEHVRQKHSEERYKIDCDRISEFVRFAGKKIKVEDLKPSHVSDWLESKQPLKPGTIRQYTAIILAALNWASSKKVRLIQQNHLKGMLELPEGGSRSAEVVWKKETFETVLRVANPAFANAVRILAWTGARPNVICEVESKHYKKDHALWDIKDQNPARINRKKPKKRIWLPPQAVTLVEELNLKYPEGPIFRNSKGEPWSSDSLGVYFYQLRHKFKKTKDLDWQPGICLYGLRHTFATNFLKEHPDKLMYLRELMGHKDLKMIQKHYGHLYDEHAAIHEVLDDIKFF